MSDIFGVGDAVQAGATIASAAMQADAINNATDAQRDAFNTITTNNKPFLNTGTSALDQLATVYGLNGKTQSFDPFTASPDYQFRFDQGIKGVDAGAAARGMLDSGATRKAEIKYAGNLASGEYGNYATRLMDLAKVGQSSANNQATSIQNYANNVGNLGMASANGWGNALNGVAGQVGGVLSRSPTSSSYGSTISGFGNGYAGSGLYNNGMFIG